MRSSFSKCWGHWGRSTRQLWRKSLPSWGHAITSFINKGWIQGFTRHVKCEGESLLLQSDETYQKYRAKFQRVVLISSHLRLFPKSWMQQLLTRKQKSTIVRLFFHQRIWNPNRLSDRLWRIQSVIGVLRVNAECWALLTLVVQNCMQPSNCADSQPSLLLDQCHAIIG